MLTIERAKAIKAMKDNRYNGEQIGKAFNISRQRVSQILKWLKKVNEPVGKKLSPAPIDTGK